MAFDRGDNTSGTSVPVPVTTTVGTNLLTLPDPSAVTYVQVNADNSVSTISGSTLRSAIGAGTGNGTVTSVAISGGTTGLTTSGGPITSSGTVTLTGTLAVANGGTGATTATDARTNLGLGSMATQSASNVSITGGSVSGITDLAVTDGGTGASTASGARTNLGATTVGSNLFTLTNPSAVTFPRFNADNSVSSLSATDFRTAIGAGTGSGTVTSVTGTSPIASSGGTTPAISLSSGYGDTLNPYASKTANYVLASPNGSAGVPTFRALVAADIPTLNQNTTGTASNVTGTVAVANGGTGATSASNARVNLLPSYSSNNGKVLAVNSGATDVEWISVGGSGTVTSVDMSVPTGFAISGNPITSAGTLALTFASGYSLPTTSSQSNWDTAYTDRLKWDGGSTGLNASTARTSLGLVIGTDVQAYDPDLAAIAALSPTADNFIVGNGSTWTLETPADARTSLGLGTAATMTGPSGTIVGTTDTQTLTNKRVTPRVSTTSSSATPTINTDTTDIFGLTAQAADITSFTTNLSGTPTDGQKLWIYIVGTAARAITWGASFESSTVTLPTTTVSTNRLDVGFVWNAATSKWRCVATA